MLPVQMRLYYIKAGPKSSACCLCKRTHSGKPQAVAAGRGTPRSASGLQRLGEKHGTDSPSEPLEGANLVNTLVQDLLLPEPCECISVVPTLPVHGSL